MFTKANKYQATELNKKYGIPSNVGPKNRIHRQVATSFFQQKNKIKTFSFFFYELFLFELRVVQSLERTRHKNLKKPSISSYTFHLILSTGFGEFLRFANSLLCIEQLALI